MLMIFVGVPFFIPLDVSILMKSTSHNKLIITILGYHWLTLALWSPVHLFPAFSSFNFLLSPTSP